MEKYSGSWYPRQHLDPQFLEFPFETGQLTTAPVRKNPCLFYDPTLGTVPSFPAQGLQQPKSSVPTDTWNWPHSMRNSHQHFTHTAPKEKLTTIPLDLGQQVKPIIGNAPSQKRFLVIDQSGDKTTYMYSSVVETGIKSGTRWMPEPPNTYILSKKDLPENGYPLEPITTEEHGEDSSRDFTENEMREDTEELNALLYSDTDGYFSEEDEETSTGHSPSSMTDNGLQNLVEEAGEEVDSFYGSTKKQKLSDEVHNVPSDTASSGKTHEFFSLGDDAESCCGKRKRPEVDNSHSSSGGKRSTKEKIRDTVRILQSIVPNANGKDSIVVIEEAIHYLRSLKVKAKALGLDDTL